MADKQIKTKSGYIGTLENGVLILTRESQARLCRENIARLAADELVKQTQELGMD